MTIKQRQEVIKAQLLIQTISPQELMGFLVLSNEQLKQYATGKPYFDDERYLDFLEFIGIDKYAIGYVDPKSEEPLKTPLDLLRPKRPTKNQPFKAIKHVFMNLVARTPKSYKEEFAKKHLFERNFGYTEPFIYKYILFGTMILFGLSYLLAELIVLENVMISLSIPLSLLILAYEFDKHDQINLKDVLYLFFIGGISSLGITYMIRSLTGYPSLLAGDLVTGFVEETAKLIACMIFIRRIKFKNVFTAFVVGFAIGAGFDAFETMEYGLNAIVSTGNYYEALFTLLARTALSFGIGHHYWTGIIFATFIGLSKTFKPDYHKLYHPTFLFVYVFISLFHAFFNYSDILTQLGMAVFGAIVFPYIGYQFYLKRFTEKIIETVTVSKEEPLVFVN